MTKRISWPLRLGSSVMINAPATSTNKTRVQRNQAPAIPEMLILGRKPEDSIVILVAGAEIRIKVLAVGQGHVSLGFTAPANAVILREELIEARRKKAV